MKNNLPWRLFVDRWATRLVSVGGIGVIAAVALIFFYLLYEIVPLFRPADAHQLASYGEAAAGPGDILYLAMEEQGEFGLRIINSGEMQFFSTADGSVVKTVRAPIPAGSLITSVAGADPDGALIAMGLDTGGLLVMSYRFRVSFKGKVRSLTPVVEYPYGETLIDLGVSTAIAQVSIQQEAEATSIIAATRGGDLRRVRFVSEESFLGLEDEVTAEPVVDRLGQYDGEVCRLLMDRVQRLIYLADCDGKVHFYSLTDAGIKLIETRSVVAANARLTAMEFVSGTYSFLVGDSRGRVNQWFPVRDENNRLTLQQIREFKVLTGQAPISKIVAEQRRKGFAVLAEDGRFGLYNSTAQRQLLEMQVDTGFNRLALAPRADFLLFDSLTGGQQFWGVDNEHPEISWSSLWDKVWYESYPEPDYVWQSSAATNDFEPKFSLTPLVFGTIKAAFYAMLFAAPLAILGAVYTGYFMHPRMRGLVKPAIENMGALPTVIIGFLAGLWLAPVLEDNLPGLFSLLLFAPLLVLLASFAYYRLPQNTKSWIPEGMEGLFLIPYLLLVGWACFAASSTVEHWLFGGDMRSWVTSEWGLDFDQRNSIVVGIAMGVAVIPTIFSMAEDAIFSVPKHLTQGSLALGATRWQTLSRVVILTASPGIFSAVMIGLGRAVGETMIVLMATGNTPLMDLNIFTGMRTLSANIAVEMPESEVGSTHFRVLFLAAMVLFGLTFVFNTAAELVRQRLRERYSSL